MTNAAGSAKAGKPVFAIVLLLYLALSALYIGQREVRLLADDWRAGGDFAIFHAAGRMAVSGERSDLYDIAARRTVRPEHREAVGNYFNPPGLALLFAPLARLHVLDARLAFIFISAAAGLGIALLSLAWTRDRFRVLLACLAVASFWPTYSVILVGHPTHFYVLAFGAAVIAFERGRQAWGGALVSLLVLKPSLLVAPLGYVAFMGNRRAVAAAAAGVLLVGLAPFLLLGPGSIPDYSRLLSASRSDAFSIHGSITAGAAFMFNWNGFVARLLVTQPAPLLVFPFYLVTVLLMAKAWASGGRLEAWLAAMIATSLAMPHFIYYDPTMLLPPALALALTRPRPALLGLLLLTHLSTNLSMLQLYWGGLTLGTKSGYMFVAAAPASLLLLAYLAFEAELDALAARLRRRRPAVVEAAA